jgi:outer membrane murein-binding lipoprotein Lpp
MTEERRRKMDRIIDQLKWAVPLGGFIVTIATVSVAWGVNKEQVGNLRTGVSTLSTRVDKVEEAVMHQREDLREIKTHLIYIRQGMDKAK